MTEINQAFINDLAADIESAKSVNEEKDERLTEVLKKCLIDPSAKIIPPTYLLHIGEAPLFPLGDVSLIIGKAKSKKTRFLAWITASMMKQGAGCIWFDTEQSRGFAQNILRLIISEAGCNDIEFYALREHAPHERVELIEGRLNTAIPGSIVVIDGVRDLVTDFNNPEQATQNTTWLMKLSSEKSIHITCVLHQNKGDANARGHLGTELTNKATTVISVEKDSKNPEYSTVTPEYSRDVPFEPFRFRITEDGGFETDSIITSEIPRKKMKVAFDYDLSVHTELSRNVFARSVEYSYSHLLSEIKFEFEKIGDNLSDARSKSFLTHWNNNGLIIHNGLYGKNAKYTLSVQSV